MRKITLDDVARLTAPANTVPIAPAFSPDGRVLTYLHGPEGSLVRALYALDVEGGEPRVLFDGDAGAPISRDEALRRERQRLMHTGVTQYLWAERAPVIVVPLAGDAWVIEDGAARRVAENVLDPRPSPDGTRLAFVRDGDLWVFDGAERRLTHDATDGVTNGVAEYVAQEEMDRSRGFWWSDDGTLLAYQHVDERHIPEYVIPHWHGDRRDVERHRYPFAGADNVRWRLGIVPANGGETRWVELPPEGEYLARVTWSPDGRLLVQTLTRDQKRLELSAVAPDGEVTRLHVEESPFWLNLHNDLRCLSDGSFVWSSERGGTRQLELRAPDGSLLRPLTTHPFPVDRVVALDADERRVAYAAAPSPVEQHLFVVDLDGGSPEQLTKEPGSHGAVFSRGFEWWVHAHTAITQPPTVVLRGRDERPVHTPPPVDVALTTPELFTFAARDGETLHGMLYRPARLPAPLVVSVYGGPHAQKVADAWPSTVDLTAQYLAQEGFAVLKVDNRGSPRRGVAFEAAIARRMGTIEVDDQVDGIRFAQAQGWVDGDRVGMFGWSYGGYMTIMSMLKAPDVVRVGVAGAPVTSWDGYDTCYTERYMGTPDDNAEGYADASALTHAAALRGRLLVIHGMIDENVHFRHTARFLDVLAKQNRRCDLLVLAAERHSPRSERDRRNMVERIVGYFQEHL